MNKFKIAVNVYTTQPELLVDQELGNRSGHDYGNSVISALFSA